VVLHEACGDHQGKAAGDDAVVAQVTENGGGSRVLVELSGQGLGQHLGLVLLELPVGAAAERDEPERKADRGLDLGDRYLGPARDGRRCG
jgi:hypothetical protein